MGSRMRFLVFAGLVFFMLAAGKTTACADGFLYITSIPEKTIVKIAGETQGTTPISVSLPTGTYFVEAGLTSYRSTSQNVVVNEGEVTRVELTLDKVTSFRNVVPPVSISNGKGNITFVTDWTPAEIYLDGVKQKERPPVTIKNIPAGIHWLILTSKGYAIYQELTLQNQETRVFRGYFEKVKAGTYQPWAKSWERGGTARSPLNKATAREIEKKQQALPAAINLKMTTTKQNKDSSTLWGKSDSVVVTFQYRKSGTETWETKELQLKIKEEDSFTIENGTYEVWLTATHYKMDTGLLTILVGSSKKKVGEANQHFTKEFAADKLYVYNIVYDGTVTLNYNVTESNQNTKIE